MYHLQLYCMYSKAYTGILYCAKHFLQKYLMRKFIIKLQQLLKILPTLKKLNKLNSLN